MSTVKMVGLSGSMRKGSANGGLLRCAQRNTPPRARMELVEIRALSLSLHAQSWLDATEEVKEAVDRVVTADALVLALPLDNGRLTPVLDNFLAWVQMSPTRNELRGKPVALMGAGRHGPSDETVSGLKQLCMGLGLVPLRRPELFVHEFERGFDVYGEVCSHELEAGVAGLMERLNDSVQRPQIRRLPCGLPSETQPSCRVAWHLGAGAGGQSFAAIPGATGT